MIAVRELSVVLGGRRVLDGVSFDVPKGMLVAVLGANGSGKTTLLRAVAGLLAYSGGIELAGQDAAALGSAQRARLVAYVPQGHQADWPLAARDVVAIGRMPHGGGPGRLRESDIRAVENALVAVDATHLSSRPVTELSGGERARIMLARALAVAAPVLLADEPVAALDPQHQLRVIGLLQKVAANGGAVLAALHDLTLAARFADAVIVLDAGRIAAQGRPADVLTADLLERVFQIEAHRFVHDGQCVILPWSTETDSHR